LVGLILVLSFQFDFGKTFNTKVLDQLLNTSAIFSGFLLTLYGMISSLNTLRVARLELFKSIKKDLKKYLIEAVVWNISLHLIILVYYILQIKDASLNWTMHLFIFSLTVLAFSTTIRFAKIFIHLAGGKEIDEK